MLYFKMQWIGVTEGEEEVVIILSDSFVVTGHGVAHLLVIEKSGKMEEFYF